MPRSAPAARHPRAGRPARSAQGCARRTGLRSPAPNTVACGARPPAGPFQDLQAGPRLEHIGGREGTEGVGDGRVPQCQFRRYRDQQRRLWPRSPAIAARGVKQHVPGVHHVLPDLGAQADLRLGQPVRPKAAHRQDDVQPLVQGPVLARQRVQDRPMCRCLLHRRTGARSWTPGGASPVGYLCRTRASPAGVKPPSTPPLRLVSLSASAVPRTAARVTLGVREGDHHDDGRGRDGTREGPRLASDVSEQDAPTSAAAVKGRF